MKKGVLFPFLLTVSGEGLVTKDPTKHAGLSWLSAEKFSTTLCALKTLCYWRTEAPLA